MKKRIYFYLSERDEKLLNQKIAEQGFEGKGRVERFMERIVRNKVLILVGDDAEIIIKSRS